MAVSEGLDLNKEPAVRVDQLGVVTSGIQKHHQILFVKSEGGCVIPYYGFLLRNAARRLSERGEELW